jgi:hypothetical protein
MSFESSPPSNAEQNEDVSEREQIKEAIFLTYIHSKLLDAFFDSLEDVVESDQELEEWRLAMADIPADHLNALLAMPYELRRRRLEVLRGRIADGKPVVSVVVQAAAEAYAHGYKVGYHASPHKVSPTIDSKTGREAWTIDGREVDHRDSDHSRAYYSTDLAHLYHRKNPKYLYLVRAETGEESTHNPDNNGSWGRAGKLDVIAAVDYQESMEEVDRRYQEYLRNLTEESPA